MLGVGWGHYHYKCKLTTVLKSIEYTMSWSKNLLLIVIDTHKLHS